MDYLIGILIGIVCGWYLCSCANRFRHHNDLLDWIEEKKAIFKAHGDLEYERGVHAGYRLVNEGVEAIERDVLHHAKTS